LHGRVVVVVEEVVVVEGVCANIIGTFEEKKRE
jgi:hypothetical protein